MTDSAKIDTPSKRAKRTISRRSKKIQPENLVVPFVELVKEEIKFKLDPPDPSVPFKHINAEEQLRGSVGSVVNYQQDLFDVIDPMNHTLTLTFTPISSSETISWNGLVLRPGMTNDYVISGNTIILNAGMQLTVGDGFLAKYSY